MNDAMNDAMNVVLFTHPAGLAHDTGPGHPECPDRLRYVWQALEAEVFAPLARQTCPVAPFEAVLAAHTQSHVDTVLAHQPPPGGLDYIDADTVVSAGSIEAALHAAGGAMAAVDAVLDGSANAAFVAMRPPGHHAQSNRPMGFCLFNNAAIAALHARDKWGLRRIAVVDFDVHHGNGTQDIFYNDRDLFYASSHQHPFYPGTGQAHERGIAGNVMNAPLAAGAGSAEFRAAWSGLILPALAEFRPELLIISAGFDAHRADPLALLELEVADFTWVTQALLAVADAHCPGRVVSLLEGGYDLPALAACAAAHVKALLRAA
jgi:acetoin utilization deacetylase AcuC-like enzyme